MRVLLETMTLPRIGWMNIISPRPRAMSDSPPSRSCALLHERRTERPVAKEGSRETGLRDEIEHLARGHDGLGCRDALLREPIDLPGERLDLSNAGRWAG